jgi:CheY-like chemotaxis protein
VKILVIDDEVAVASLIAEAVERQRHEALVAHDGEQGLALLDRVHPDAVFLDVRMPGIDGIEFLRRIRKTYPVLPVILITGSASPDDVAEARLLGVTEVLEKPVFLKRLTGALDALQ